MSPTKPYVISKWQVWRAFALVKANAGAAGIDEQTLADYQEKLQDNLYRLWNRLSSGSYFPPAVKAVAIPKKTGGERILGIPTVSDRIAQMVVKLEFEPAVEPHFLAEISPRLCRGDLTAFAACKLSRSEDFVLFPFQCEFGIGETGRSFIMYFSTRLS